MAAASLISPSALMNSRGIVIPLIGKVLDRPLGLGAPKRILRNLEFTHAVLLCPVSSVITALQNIVKRKVNRIISDCVLE